MAFRLLHVDRDRVRRFPIHRQHHVHLTFPRDTARNLPIRLIQPANVPCVPAYDTSPFTPPTVAVTPANALRSRNPVPNSSTYNWSVEFITSGTVHSRIGTDGAKSSPARYPRSSS
jgi:hypothetical protein